MNCPKCGEVLEDGMRFCTKCGANIEEAMKEEKEKIRLEAEKLKKEQEEREAKRLEYEKRERELKEEAERRRKEEEKRQKELKEAEERRKIEEEKKREELRIEKEKLEEEKRRIEEEKRKLEEDKLRAIREAEEIKREKEEQENKEKQAEENAKKAVEASNSDQENEKVEPKIPKEAEFKPAKQETVVKKKRKGFIRRFFDRLILLIIILVILIGGIYYLNLKGYLPEPVSNEINELIDQIKSVRSGEKEEYKNKTDEENAVEENEVTGENIDNSEWVVENTIEADDIENLNKDVSAIVKDGKYGIIDNKTGKILLDIKYENISLVAGEILVTDNGKTYSVDSKYQLGEETKIIEDTIRLEYLFNVLDNKAYVYTGSNSLKEVSKDSDFSEDLIVVEGVTINEDDMSISNEEIEVNYENINHLGKYGVYNVTDNKLVAECGYDKIYNYSENYAAYKKENVSGFLNNSGQEIEVTFEETRNVYDGVAWVKLDGKWGIAKIAK